MIFDDTNPDPECALEVDPPFDAEFDDRFPAQRHVAPVTVARFQRACSALLSLAPLWIVTLAVAQPVPGAKPAAPKREMTLSGSFRLEALDITCEPEPGIADGGRCRAVGDVELQTGDARILADELIYTQSTQILTATGSVVLSFPGASLAGSKLVYHADTRTGTVDDVTGYLSLDNATIRAEQVQRLDDARIGVTKGTFTTCTQPVPYWSFYVGKGVFELGEYAHMRNVAFRVRRVPVFFSPYLIYPIKGGRASGVLFPEFGTSDKLGKTLTVPLYWAARDNIDLLFGFSGYSKVGYGVRTDLSMLPTWNGRTDASFDYINDQIRGQSRWNLVWRGRQPFGERTRMIARVEAVSDFDYFTDYESDLLRSSQPQTDSTIDITKQWSWYTLSVRARRQEQFFVGASGPTALGRLTSKAQNEKLPEIELRGRSQRLGRTPLYFSFQSSLDRFGKRILEAPDGQLATEDELVTVADERWFRADVAPTLRAPVLRQSWADFELNFGWRGTYYSATVDPDDKRRAVGVGLSRSLFSAGFGFSGPRFQRVYKTPNWSFSPKLKHVIEPFVDYRYRPRTESHSAEIIRVDSIDDDPSALSDFSYGVRQRLFVLRPPQAGSGAGLASAKDTSFDALERQSKEQAAREQKEAELAKLGLLESASTANEGATPSLAPVEIASFEISQSYSLVRPLTQIFSRVFCTGGDAVNPSTGRPCTAVTGDRNYSAIRMRLRYNPSSEQSVDVSYTLDPANEVLSEASISTLIRLSTVSYLDGRLYRRRPINPAISDKSTYGRLRWGWLTKSQSLGVETDWDYNLESRQLEHQSYRLRYATQCCAFRFGWDRRDFEDNNRQEYYLVVDLSGLGKLIDLKQAR